MLSRERMRKRTIVRYVECAVIRWHDRGGVREPMAIARSASSSGGWGREGVRSEARAEQRLAPGGRAALPLTRTKHWRAALPLTRTKHWRAALPLTRTKHWRAALPLTR